MFIQLLCLQKKDFLIKTGE